MDDGQVHVTTDGGSRCECHEVARTGATGYAVHCKRRGVHGCGASPLGGADQSSWPAEIEALREVVQAAVVTQTDVALYIDNKGVVNTFQAILDGT